MSLLLGQRKKTKRHTELARIWFGNHAFSVLIIGDSRTGKTILLCQFMNDYIKLGNKNFINDCAKGFNHKLGVPESELMRYFSEELDAIHKIRVFVPPGCNITIVDPKKELTKDFEVIQVSSYEEIFKRIEEGGNTINVISIDAWLLDPLAQTRFWAIFVMELQERCRPSPTENTLTPLVGALDQINYIFPSRALPQSFTRGVQARAIGRFARFMMDAAGNGVRMLGTTHRLPIVHKSVREAFLWNIFKTSSSDITDIARRLAPAQKIIENLKISEMYIVDDSNRGDKVPGLEDLKFPNKPVYYEGDRIHNPSFMLKSSYQRYVMTHAELRALEKGNGEVNVDDLQDRIASLKHELLKKEVGWRVLKGDSQQQIAHDLDIGTGTVSRFTQYCRIEIDGFTEMEKILRPKGTPALLKILKSQG